MTALTCPVCGDPVDDVLDAHDDPTTGEAAHPACCTTCHPEDA